MTLSSVLVLSWMQLTLLDAKTSTPKHWTILKLLWKGSRRYVRCSGFRGCGRQDSRFQGSIHSLTTAVKLKILVPPEGCVPQSLNPAILRLSRSRGADQTDLKH